MITGIVNADCEPIILFSIRCSNGEVFTQDAIIDIPGIFPTPWATHARRIRGQCHAR